ncbi:MAG: 5-(carboxyamino)imidazole ribonucleotide synthase [Phycisphaeraceae bacterium]|nr:5-(carboxyamino)imidazole ribonucleotide synthase [Phycisphaeraceae bacterium]
MTVAILGGGQLGRMLALAAHRLAIPCRALDPIADSCVRDVAPLVVGAYDDADALRELTRGATVATYEFENVPVRALEALASVRVPIAPPPRALQVAQDRLLEKRFFAEIGLDVPDYRSIDSAAELRAAASALGLPLILKARRLGYDGRGQRRIETAVDLDAACAALDRSPAPSIVERLISFDREVSVIGVRARDGQIVIYPPVWNTHDAGILIRSVTPAPSLARALIARADHLMRAALESLDYVGVLTLELFECAGRLLGNEMACRVHNSGHWTIDASSCSQFENHIRAILGLPLGAADVRHPAVMLNILGSAPDLVPLLAIPGAHVHLYGKSPAPRRKLGHVTICAPTPVEAEFAVARVQSLLAPIAPRP